MTLQSQREEQMFAWFDKHGFVSFLSAVMFGMFAGWLVLKDITYALS